jgi:hypothetical protein
MMRTRVAGAAVAALALVAAAGATTPKWNLMPQVPVVAGAAGSQLQGISVVSPRDIWASGAWWAGTTTHPLVTHWDGAGWAASELPALPGNTYLGGIDALGHSDVWAVGSTTSDVSTDPPSVLHYDGASWRTVSIPAAPAGAHADLDGLDMRTPGDGWAVGEITAGATSQPLILHWQRGRWAGAPLPRLAASPSGLVAVTAASARDVWAVGTGSDPATGFDRGLVMRFDGRTWSPAGPVTPPGTTFNAVAVAGPGDVWVAGEICGGTGDCRGAVWHRTARGWRQVPADGGTELLTVVARGPRDVWVLGYQELGDGKKADHVEHWNGRRFTVEDTGLKPTPSSRIGHRNELGSATPIWAADDDPASGQLWAVGWSDPPSITPRVIHRR